MRLEIPVMLRFVAGTGKLGYFAADVLSALFSRAPSGWRLLEEAYGIGVRTLPVVAVVSVFIGSNIAIQGYNLFREFGSEAFVGMFAGMACTREMGPIVAGAMVAAKAGSEMASTLATMRIREQIDALEVLAVSPMWYLVVPRFLATLAVLPLLVIFADLLSLGAAYAVAVHQLHVNSGVFTASVLSVVELGDVWKGMGKGVAFALVISVFCCFRGYFAGGGARGVGRAINHSIVGVCVICIIINYFLSELMYG